MVNALVSGILQFVIQLITLVLSPIDSLIMASAPGTANILDMVHDFFDMILDFFPWILSWFNIPSALLSFICLYLIFKLTISVAIHSVKLAVAWWDKLKL